MASISSLAPSLGVFQVSFSSGQRLVVKVDAATGVTRVGAVVAAPSAAAYLGDALVLLRVEAADAAAGGGAAKTPAQYRLKFVDAASGEEKKELEQSLDLGGWRGSVEQLLGVVFSSKKDAVLTYRLVVSMEDHSLALV